MKVWVQWARSGSSAAAAAAMSAAAGANKSMLQPRNDSQMSRPRRDEYAGESHPVSDLDDQVVDVERRARPEIRRVRRQKLFRRAASLIAQHG